MPKHCVLHKRSLKISKQEREIRKKTGIPVHQMYNHISMEIYDDTPFLRSYTEPTGPEYGSDYFYLSDYEYKSSSDSDVY